MNIDNIKKIELEITSNCNAACPGCARTQNIDLFDVESFYLEDLKRLFPTERYIANKQFKFCGVLGDPALNKDAVLMTEYLTNSGGYCQWSTNGAYQTADWWSKLGQISKDTNLVDVSFCVDGHKETNHIYRVSTKWNVLERNMQAYSDAGFPAFTEINQSNEALTTVLVGPFVSEEDIRKNQKVLNTVAGISKGEILTWTP